MLHMWEETTAPPPRESLNGVITVRDNAEKMHISPLRPPSSPLTPLGPPAAQHCPLLAAACHDSEEEQTFVEKPSRHLSNHQSLCEKK